MGLGAGLGEGWRSLSMSVHDKPAFAALQGGGGEEKVELVCGGMVVLYSMLCKVHAHTHSHTATQKHTHTHAHTRTRTHTHGHPLTHSFDTMVGGSCRWSPASTHLGACSRGIQQDTSRHWAHSSMTTTSKWPTGRLLQVR